VILVRYDGSRYHYPIYSCLLIGFNTFYSENDSEFKNIVLTKGEKPPPKSPVKQSYSGSSSFVDEDLESVDSKKSETSSLDVESSGSAQEVLIVLIAFPDFLNLLKFILAPKGSANQCFQL